MSRASTIAAAVLSTAVLLFAGWRGSGVPFADQWPLFEALRNTAAIIFAVVGAWLAIVYPDRLRVSLRPNGEQANPPAPGAERVLKLVLPILNSTLILAVVLVVGLIAPLLRDFVFVREHLEFFRGTSYVILAALTLLQVWTVIFTLVPASEMRDQVLGERSIAHTTHGIFSHAKKKSELRKD